MTEKPNNRQKSSPLLELAAELENRLHQTAQTKNKKIIKTFSGNFNKATAENDIQKEEGERITKKNCKILLQEKDEQIDKLIEHINMLRNCNEQLQIENNQLKSKECDLCKKQQMIEEQLKESQEQLINENGQLQDDIKMVKTLVYRLNVQLERYQDLLRQNGNQDQNFVKINYDTEVPKVIDWGDVNSHTLGPLLQAYTEIIDEKNDLIEQYEMELNHFTGKMKQVVEENEKVHKNMDEIYQKHEIWTTDRIRLEAQLELFRSKADVQTKRADLAKEKLVEVLRCYEQKVQSQNLELERLQEAYNRTKGEISMLRNMQQSPEIMVESLKECQKLFEELKTQHENEKKKFTNEIKDLQELLRENENKFRIDSQLMEKIKDENLKQKESNAALNSKITALRQSLARIRMSREMLQNKLKVANSWKKNEKNQKLYKDQYSDLANMESTLRLKESNMQNVHLRYVTEIEKLAHKLQQRDDILKKVLQTSITKKTK